MPASCYFRAIRQMVSGGNVSPAARDPASVFGAFLGYEVYMYLICPITT